MAKESRFVYKTREINLDNVQELSISRFDVLTQESLKNINQANRDVVSITTTLDTIDSELPTAQTDYTNINTRIGDAETDVDGLTIVAPAFDNFGCAIFDHYDTSSSTNSNYFLDLTNYIDYKSGDNYTFVRPSRALIEPNKKFYVEVIGEIIADEDNVETEFSLDRSSTWIKLYQYRRTHVANIQAGGTLTLSDVNNRENFQFVYGSGNLSGGAEGDDTDKIFFKATRSYINPPGEYIMLRGVQFKYIATLESLETFNSSSGGSTYKHGYGIAFNRNSKNIDYRNLKIKIVRLN